MNLKEDGIYCDCTAGGGGHLLMMLKKTKNARFIGIDWDPDALAYIEANLGDFKERVVLYEGNFAELDSILEQLNISGLNGVLFDLGVSLHQLTTPERGFSFNHEGRLLMQFSPRVQPLYKRLRSVNFTTIFEVLKKYGDVPNAKRLAKSIFENRHKLNTTIDLRKLVEKQYSPRFLKKNLHRVFQALRIWTNDELTNLQIGLEKAIDVLYPSGRIVVISYHSGEDYIVKNVIRESEKIGRLKRLNKKVIRPSQIEIKLNPSARSARMRVGEKCALS
uniref:16S rRNA (Cytosine(1402)-N(4))-methyltransferase n=1 Tax=candidate division WOR-3 bacterium TaxID=2052148 RepID=A0A7V3VUJ7_UNCW3